MKCSSDKDEVWMRCSHPILAQASGHHKLGMVSEVVIWEPSGSPGDNSGLSLDFCWSLDSSSERSGSCWAASVAELHRGCVQ